MKRLLLRLYRWLGLMIRLTFRLGVGLLACMFVLILIFWMRSFWYEDEISIQYNTLWSEKIPWRLGVLDLANGFRLHSLCGSLIYHAQLPIPIFDVGDNWLEPSATWTTSPLLSLDDPHLGHLFGKVPYFEPGVDGEVLDKHWYSAMFDYTVARRDIGHGVGGWVIYSAQWTYWFVAGLLSPAPIYELVCVYKLLRRWRTNHKFPHACRGCRYDLRAHKAGEKCPECGAVVPGSGAAAKV